MLRNALPFRGHGSHVVRETWAWFKPTGLAATQVPLTCYTMPGVWHHTPNEPHVPRYFAEIGRLPSHRARKPKLPTGRIATKPSLLQKDWECQISHWGEESWRILLCMWHEKPCSPGTKKLSTSHCISLHESHLSWPRTWIQPLHLMAIRYFAGTRSPEPHTAQRPNSHCNCRRAPHWG
jgi:hypothetical protein